MRTVIRRSGALGDVLMTTPIAAAFKRRGHEVLIDTGSGHAYEGSADASLGSAQQGDRIIDLNLAYERRPHMHAVDAYMAEAGIHDDRTLRFLPRDRGRRISGAYVAIHAARSWANRTLPNDFWREVAARVMAHGRSIVWLGSGGDMQGEVNVWGRPLPEIAAVIDGAAAFICSDSALLHLSGCTETPIVGLFTCVRAARRMPYRHGTMTWRAVAMEADVDCVGCIEELPAPVTHVDCRRGDNLCVRSFDAADVARAALSIWR